MSVRYSSESIVDFNRVQTLITEADKLITGYQDAEALRNAAGLYLTLCAFIPGPAGWAATAGTIALGFEAFFYSPSSVASKFRNDLEYVEDLFQNQGYSQIKLRIRLVSQWANGKEYMVPEKIEVIAVRRPGYNGWELV